MYKVAITPRIRERMASLLGVNFNESEYSVYEAIANDSQPIVGGGRLYKNAVMSETFLSQMEHTAKFSYVPMIELHDEYNKLPVGRILDAELFSHTDGTKDLHVLFYIKSSNDPNSLDQKIQAGIVSSLSSGSSPKKLTCATCGFDFTASSETIEALLWEEKCGNGHLVGKDTHVVMAELQSWDELSFVTQGAVPRAKILQASKHKLANKNVDLGLAASNNIDKLRFNATTQIFNNPSDQDNGVNMSKIELELEKYNSFIKLEAQTDTLKLQLQQVNDAKVNLEKANTDLANEKAKLEADKIQLEADKTQLEADKTQLETDKAALNSEITSLKTQLATAGIPEGGKSDPAGGDPKNTPNVDIQLFKRTSN